MKNRLITSNYLYFLMIKYFYIIIYIFIYLIPKYHIKIYKLILHDLVESYNIIS